jgi:hypothetical protein
MIWPIATMVEKSSRTMNDKFILRLPDGMREAIRLAAEANNRSMNAEIVARLTTTFEVSDKAVEFLRQYELLSAVQAMPTLADFEKFNALLQEQSAKLEKLVAGLQKSDSEPK